MNKKLKILLAIAVLSGASLYATDTYVATQTDPLVTKSYVDAQISKVSGEAVSSTSNTYEIVNVPAGKAIYGKQGSEMIIRSGQGTILASTAGGVQDVTDGIDLSGGMVAPNNNLLIIPREDGRGISADKTMVVMVRGGYTIQ